MHIFNNEYIVFEEENRIIFVTVITKGYTIREFRELIHHHPTIKITKEKELNEALLLAANVKVEIGERLPPVSLYLSKDKMVASIVVNCSEEELEAKRDFYVGEVLKALHQHKVSEGILINELQENLIPQEEIVIANGKQPIDGKDAEVQYFTLSERKPTIRTDGKADYYDMNFIDEVKKGDWLGEKIPATRGIPGHTVTGEMVVPKKGKDVKLVYDRKTVGEFEEKGKFVLRALIDGVVEYVDGKISVGDHLIIDGDVGVKTGNIDFDGSVTVKGIVMHGFSVTATKDISILGEMGLSGVKGITSVNGDIFIKGGVFGQGESIVAAGKNIFVKHANECTLKAKEDIHIGYYSIGSLLKARHVLADEKNGKIIGGKLEVVGKVVAAIIGNKMERKTLIEVEGFSRQTLSQQIEEILLEYKKEVLAHKTLKNQVEAFENSTLNEIQRKQLERLQDKLDEKVTLISQLDSKYKYMMNLLEVKGEGEVTIKDTMFPETYLQMKSYRKRITSKVRGTFYIEGNVIQFG